MKTQTFAQTLKQIMSTGYSTTKQTVVQPLAQTSFNVKAQSTVAFAKSTQK